MTKKRALRTWSIKLSRGFLEVEAIVEHDSGCDVEIMPGEDLHRSAGRLLHDTFAADADVTGTLDADGDIVIRFNAFKEEVK